MIKCPFTPISYAGKAKRDKANFETASLGSSVGGAYVP
jgi:hypothetical protein